MARLKDKITLVTGGASGIGEAIAKLFHKEGATVIVADISEAHGREAIKRLGGANVHYFPLDVSQETDWKKLTENIRQQFGRLDILVNNAGTLGLDLESPQDPEHVSLDTWHRVHRVNLDGVFLGCKYAIALMKNKGGSIVNIASRSGLIGVPALAAYASSKAAVRNHTKTVALYCAEKGYEIRCNALHPAAILTPLWDPMLGTDPRARDEKMNAIERGIPLGKMGDPKDVAFAALFFASDEAKFVTGAELVLDGGILAGSSASPRPIENGHLY